MMCGTSGEEGRFVNFTQKRDDVAFKDEREALEWFFLMWLVGWADAYISLRMTLGGAGCRKGVHGRMCGMGNQVALQKRECYFGGMGAMEERERERQKKRKSECRTYRNKKIKCFFLKLQLIFSIIQIKFSLFFENTYTCIF